MFQSSKPALLRSPPEPEFRRVFDAHAAFVWRVLRRHGIGQPDLDDACQEVFLVVHRRWYDFAGRSELRTWIYGIALRVAHSMRRRTLRAQQSPDAASVELPLAADPFAHALQGQALRELEAALATVSVEQREVFVLYELEGLSMAEVAAALEVPENTALYRLYAARDSVRAHMHRRELSVHIKRSAPRTATGGNG